MTKKTKRRKSTKSGGRVTSRSGFERKVMSNLTKSGIKYRYEPYSLTYAVPARDGKYNPDLEFGDAIQGCGFLVEIKGKFTSKDRTKHLGVRKANPGVEVRFLFQRDNWLTSKHKKRYSDWCIDNGFEYFIGTSVPNEWTREVPNYK